MSKRCATVALLMSLNVAILSSCNYSFPIQEKQEQTIVLENQPSEEEIKKQIITYYEQYFNNLSVVYPYSEAYIPKESIDNMLSKLSPHTPFDIKNELSAKEIVALIKENSNNVNNNEYKSVFKEEDSEIIEDILIKIVSKILTDSNDINEDLYLIKQLKILSYPSESVEFYIDLETNGIYFDKENLTIVISSPMMFINEEVLGSKEYYNTLAFNLGHIINDIRQISLKDVNYINYLEGYHSTLSEDASSRFLKSDDGFEETNNITHIYDGDPNAILLFSMFNKEANPTNYYNAIFDEDAKKLFDIFSLKTKKDIYDFYRVMYAIDAKSYSNDFFDYYSNVEHESLSETMVQGIGNSYKLTIYNHYIFNLLQYLKDNPMSLEENLTMYYIGLNILCENIDTSKTNINLIYTLNNMNEGHDKYMEFLCLYYNVDYDYIINASNTIVINNINKINNKEDNIFIKKYPMLKLITQQPIPINCYEKMNIDNLRSSTLSL
ncbi:MAG: hypothetical protein IJ572_00515 [Bacilli bacterium]|nr:hypothetical protein [Bacilli bacterium]